MNPPLIRLSLIVVLWGAAACVAGAYHLLAHLPAPGVLIAVMTAAFYLSVLRVPWLGEAFRSLGLRGILVFHLGRFLGFYFLWLHAQGRLPAEFAFRAGWGDVVAAGGALALLFPWQDGPPFRRALAVWNWIGLLDLVVAVGTASWLSVTRPGSMLELSVLPLTLVPLYLVPLLVTSHLLLMRPDRVMASARRSPSGALQQL
jgi:hypothetical protein